MREERTIEICGMRSRIAMDIHIHPRVAIYIRIAISSRYKHRQKYSLQTHYVSYH